MSDLVSSFVFLENSLPYHEARLLLLVKAFSGGHASQSIVGLTKLAKLDFLLRYPTMLERSLAKKKKPTGVVSIQNHERLSVESKMVRYRFGPWDHRYRSILNSLIGRGLVWMRLEGRTCHIGVTPKGIQVATRLASSESHEIVYRRAQVLKAHFDVKATTLVKFIYDNFPEVVSLRMREAID